MTSTSLCTIAATQNHGRSSMNALISWVEWAETMIFSLNVLASTTLIPHSKSRDLYVLI
jgi:hypothetical protein